MRKTLISIAFITSLLAPMAQAADGVLLDEIVAIVNDDVVLRSELENEFSAIREQIARQGGGVPPDDQLRRQVLERLVISELQLQRAEEAGIRVSDDQVNQALSGIAERNGITLAQMPEVLAQQGVDYNLYRAAMRDEIIIDQIRRREVDARISISDAEVGSFLDRQRESDQSIEFRLEHILLAVPANSDDDVVRQIRSRAVALAERARGGEEFSQLAIAESDGQNALEGGDLGWRTPGQVPSIFAEVVRGLQVGDVSEPIRSASGFHIVRLADRRQAQALVVKQSKINHILIRPTEVLSSDAARAKLAELRERILSGDIEFSAAAREHSADPVSASRGGDMGWTNPGTYVPAFEQVAASLEKGELSEPFETRFGWHLIQVQDRRDFDGTDEARRNQAYATLQQQKLEAQTEVWIRKLRDQAYVEYLL